MSYMEFKNIVTGRRCVRKFTDQPVNKDDIRDLVDHARHAPSDTNSQAWEFIAVMDKEKINYISEMTWEELHNIAKKAELKGFKKEAKLLLRSFGPYATSFVNAPVLMICLASPYKSKFRDKIFDPVEFVPESVWYEEGIKSSSLAAQNLMLAAHAKGLATCPMTGPVLIAKDRLAEYLNLEPSLQINMVIALGYPSEIPNKPSRKEIDEILHFI